MTIADQIRDRLLRDATHSGSEHVIACAATYSRTLTAVLDEHEAQRIYEPCGHQHEPGDPDAREVDDVGVVCEDGYLYSICWGCCTDRTGYQSEACASNHEGCWPCSTLHTVADGLGITEPTTHTNPEGEQQ